MANFSTHINTAAVVSGISAMSLAYTGMVAKPFSFVLFFAGTIGGILPDIDHDKSTPIKIMQYFFANLGAFLVTYKYVGHKNLIHLVLIWIITYALISVVFLIFKKLTAHRGIFHSIPMAFVFWFSVTVLCFKFFNLGIYASYLTGFFVFLGYTVHLLLDEIYAVDITGAVVKKSFGSALKFTSNSKTATYLCYISLLAVFMLLPHKIYIIKIIERFLHV